MCVRSDRGRVPTNFRSNPFAESRAREIGAMGQEEKFASPVRIPSNAALSRLLLGHRDAVNNETAATALALVGAIKESSF